MSILILSILLASLIFRPSFAQDGVNINLPTPSLFKRERHVIPISDNNGYVCHNYVRERQINNKLEEQRIRLDTSCQGASKLALDVHPDVSLFDSHGLVIGGFAVSFAAGAVAAILIINK
jgi:hypothetical protein